MESIAVYGPRPRADVQEKARRAEERAHRRLQRDIDRELARIEERAKYKRASCPNCDMVGFYDGLKCIYCGHNTTMPAGTETRTGQPRCDSCGMTGWITIHPTTGACVYCGALQVRNSGAPSRVEQRGGGNPTTTRRTAAPAGRDQLSAHERALLPVEHGPVSRILRVR